MSEGESGALPRFNATMVISEKPLLTTKDVADILQVSTMTVLRWMNEGLISAIKVRYTVRFREEDIKRFIEEHYVGPPISEKVLLNAS